MNTTDVTTLSELELYKTWHATVATLEQTQANLRTLNDEIARRYQPVPAVEEKPKKK